MKKQTLIVLGLVAIGAAGMLGILRPETVGETAHDHEEVAEGGDDKQRVESGPHGGRMLRDGSSSVEVQMVEEPEPRFRLFVYSDGKQVTADGIEASIELTRFGGLVDRIEFVPRGEFLESRGVVTEPHSFDVAVRVNAAGQAHAWSYATYEYRVKIDPVAAQTAGVELAQAGPALISESLLLYGVIIPDERRLRTVSARFPGIVREVRRNLGDRVRAGETLALVESNESLQTYPVPAPIAGVILSRSVNPGEIVGDESLLTIADLSTVVAELAVFRRDLRRVRVGQPVRVKADEGGIDGSGSVTFISPMGSGESQSVKLRVELDNRDGRWQPGMFVIGEVKIVAAEVPVAVARSALQKLRDWDVVFANVGDAYEPKMLELGRMDRDYAEVKTGIGAGDRYVVANSFLIKAEIGKAGAGHEH
jgi:cobalt-zinc-cadmium efflux system membrane fusion protein